MHNGCCLYGLPKIDCVYNSPRPNQLITHMSVIVSVIGAGIGLAWIRRRATTRNNADELLPRILITKVTKIQSKISIKETKFVYNSILFAFSIALCHLALCHLICFEIDVLRLSGALIRQQPGQHLGSKSGQTPSRCQATISINVNMFSMGGFKNDNSLLGWQRPLRDLINCPPTLI